MSEKYKFYDPDGLYFITTTIVGWVDIFTKELHREILLDSLRYCQKHKGLIIHAWVIMSNHAHFIISRSGTKTPGQILNDFKVYTSIEMIKSLKSGHDSRKSWLLNIFSEEAKRTRRALNYKVWRDGNHPVLLDDNKKIQQRLDYLHDNPVRAGIVSHCEDYVYSSAIDYSGGKGLLELELIL